MLNPVPKAPPPWRSIEYRAFIRRQPCLVPGCKLGIIAAHHQPKKGETNRPKCGDDRCLPLCLHHHIDGGLPNLPGNYHGMGKITGWKFYELYDLDPEKEISRLNKMWREK